jgi:hemoglobin-like flavoprotein
MLVHLCEGFSKPDTIHLVQSSFARLSTRVSEFAERFYAILFGTHPELSTVRRFDERINPDRLW